MDVDIKQLGRDWRGQFGDERDEGCCPGRPGVDAGARELVVERLTAEGMAGKHAREQPRNLVGQASGEIGTLTRCLDESVKEPSQAGRKPQPCSSELENILSEMPCICSLVR